VERGLFAMAISLLIFTTVIVNLYSGIYVFLANRSSRINKVFLLICVTLSLWGIGYTFMLGAGSESVAVIWRIVGVLGECFLFSSFLLFGIEFTNQHGILGKSLTKFLLFVPSLLLFFDGVKNSTKDFILTEWGWMYSFAFDGLWRDGFIIYYLIYTLSSVWLVYLWAKKAATIREKKQAWIIIVITLMSLTMGTFYDVGLPLLGIKTLPFDIVVMTMLTGGIWYAIMRYRFMILSFELAADHILTDMVDPLVLTDRKLIITEVNKAAERLTGYTKEELIGQSFDGILRGQFEAAAARYNWLNDGNLANMEVVIPDRKEGQVPCLLSAKTFYDEFHEVSGMIFLLHDITKRKKYEQLLKKTNDELEQKVHERTVELQISNLSLQKEITERKNIEAQLQYAATHDSLTSLPNRRLYHERLKSAIHKMKLGDEAAAVVFLDLDNFKFLNDTFGHNYGDLVLKEVASQMKRIIKKSDTLARLGGDEFLILVEKIDKDNIENSIKNMLANLLEIFKQPYVINGRECFLSVSIGVALYPEDGKDAETLIKNADIAMYEAKYTGKGMYKICSSQMKQKASEKSEIRNLLFRALERNEFMLYYQPQIHIVSKKIQGFEALLRWQVNQERFIPPNEFIPIAEETGLIVPIGRWVIDTAFRQLKEWHNMGYTHLRMAVNVSARQLVEKDFVKRLVGCLDQLDLDHQFVELEITESIAFNKDAAILDMLQEIQNENISISIDDFGTEYSSFMNIKDVPVSRLKIAMPFVSGISKNVKDAAIVSSIIALSHNLGLNVIAEGVENQVEAEYLGMEKCDEIQGFYYYRPMPPESITAILNNKGDGKYVQ
jgi:diguanylate cyclase (GGDEF)-like protein/PAS domain S-box-containing protein